MAYTLLDAAYAMYYPEQQAEFAFGSKARRAKRMRGRLLGRTGAGRAARIGGLLGAAALAGGAARYGGQAIRVGKAAYGRGGLVGAGKAAAGSVGRGIQSDLSTLNKASANQMNRAKRGAAKAYQGGKRILVGPGK